MGKVTIKLSNLRWTPNVRTVPSTRTGDMTRFDPGAPAIYATLSHGVTLGSSDGTYSDVHSIPLPDRSMPCVPVALGNRELEWRVNDQQLLNKQYDVHLQLSVFKVYTSDLLMQNGRGLESTAVAPLSVLATSERGSTVMLKFVDLAQVDNANFHEELDGSIKGRQPQNLDDFCKGVLTMQVEVVISLGGGGGGEGHSLAFTHTEIDKARKRLQAAAEEADSIVAAYDDAVNGIPHLMFKMRMCNAPSYAHLYALRTVENQDSIKIDSIQVPAFAAFNKEPELPPPDERQLWTNIEHGLLNLLRISMHDHNMPPDEFEAAVADLQSQARSHLTRQHHRAIEVALEALSMAGVVHPYRSDRSHVSSNVCGRHSVDGKNTLLRDAISRQQEAEDAGADEEIDQLITLGVGALPDGLAVFNDCEDGNLRIMQLWTTILKMHDMDSSSVQSPLLKHWAFVLSMFVPVVTRAYCGDGEHGRSRLRPVEERVTPADAEVHAVVLAVGRHHYYNAVLRGIDRSLVTHPHLKDKLHSMQQRCRSTLNQLDNLHPHLSDVGLYTLETTNWYSSSLVPPIGQYQTDPQASERRSRRLDTIDQWMDENEAAVGTMRSMGAYKSFPYSMGACTSEQWQQARQMFLSEPHQNRMYSFYLASMNLTPPIWESGGTHPPDDFCSLMLFGYDDQKQATHGAMTQQLALNPAGLVLQPVQFISHQVYQRSLQPLNDLQFPSFIMRRMDPDRTAPAVMPCPKNDMLHGPAPLPAGESKSTRRAVEYWCSPMRQDIVSKFLTPNVEPHTVYWKYLAVEDSMNSFTMRNWGLLLAKLKSQGSITGFNYFVYSFDNGHRLYEVRVYLGAAAGSSSIQQQ